MDRNSITGLILMVLLTVVYFYFFAPEPDPNKPANKPQTNTEIVQDSLKLSISEPDSVASEATSDSVESARLQDQYSDLFHLATGEEKLITVTTDELTVNISSRGGRLESVFLNNHFTSDSLPLPILSDHAKNEFYFPLAYNGRAIRSDELYFTPSASNFQITGEETKTLKMKAEIEPGKYIEQVYHFTGNTFDVGYEINFEGIRESLGRESSYTIFWTSYLPKTEQDIKNMRSKSTIVYRAGNDVEKMSVSDDVETEKVSALVRWVSFKSQFFSQILVADEGSPFRSSSLTMSTPEYDETVNRIMEAKMVVDIDKSNSNHNSFMFYMGPNEYYTLNAYDLQLEDEMDLGWWIVGWINKGTVYVFKFLENYISNYGIIIILLAFLIRFLMFPLSYKSYVSMAKMRVLNNTPEMKALDEKHKGDPQKLQMAKMGIYREMGVSMFGGCLPMLLSYPFLIALFFFFPQSVELRQQSFLWAHDLSTYDSVLDLPFSIPAYGDHVSLFTILMAISTMIYTLYQQKSQPTAGNNQMKYIAYFMPVFLLVFLNSYASGLSLYYFMSNIIQITQTTVIRYFLDDKKLLAQMHETQKAAKKKGKGKGKGGNGGGTKSKSRLERWVENQQKKQQDALKQRKQSDGPNRRSRRQK